MYYKQNNSKILLKNKLLKKGVCDEIPQYIDFFLSSNRYDKVIDCLEQHCEKSNDFLEIEYVFYIIKDLREQKDEFFENLLADYNNI